MRKKQLTSAGHTRQFFRSSYAKQGLWVDPVQVAAVSCCQGARQAVQANLEQSLAADNIMDRFVEL